MMSDEMAEKLAGKFRQLMTYQTETNHQPQILKQWQREWGDTDQAYRDVWHGMAVEAQNLVAGPIEVELEPVSTEPVSVSDFEPETRRVVGSRSHGHRSKK